MSQGQATATAKVDMEQFIRAWQGSTSVKEVAKKTGLKEGTCQQRATKYRTKHLVPLKNMKRGGGSTFDQQAALKLVAELNGTDIKTVEQDSAKLVEAKQKRDNKKTEATAGAN